MMSMAPFNSISASWWTCMVMAALSSLAWVASGTALSMAFPTRPMTAGIRAASMDQTPDIKIEKTGTGWLAYVASWDGIILSVGPTEEDVRRGAEIEIRRRRSSAGGITRETPLR